MKISILFFLIWASTAVAQLAVNVLPPKTVGQKTVVTLELTNMLAEPIQSARAVCFLSDGQGKVVGQSAKWVIGQDHLGLEPKCGTTFTFVLTSSQPWTTTNVTAKVSFSRVVLGGGKLADVQHDVTVNDSAK